MNLKKTHLVPTGFGFDVECLGFLYCAICSEKSEAELKQMRRDIVKLKLGKFSRKIAERNLQEGSISIKFANCGTAAFTSYAGFYWDVRYRLFGDSKLTATAIPDKNLAVHEPTRFDEPQV